MKRILRESQWKVTLTTTQGQTLEKVETAPRQDIAVSRALQAFPGMQFLNVTATALDLQTPPGQAPVLPQQQLPRQPVGMKPLQPLMMPGQQQQESFERRLRYPYSISLPAQFARLLNETSPVRVLERHGQHHVVFITEDDMKGFLDRLRTYRDWDAAKTIINGIRSSIPE